MKRLFKKNQIMIVALALMITVAGYLNFAGNNISEEDLAVSGDSVYEESGEIALLDISEGDIESLDAEYEQVDDFLNEETAELTGEELNAFISQTVDSDSIEAQMEGEVASGEELTVDEIPGEAVFTAASAIANLSDAKLIKEQTRSKNKETLLEIINNENISEEQKQDAINSMVEMTAIAEKEMSAEILLEAKGFDGAVVSICGDSADVCVAVEKLTDIQCAQIIDIVQRKTEILGENIVITPVNG